MKLTEELKQKLDNMSYYSLLYEWRFSPIGSEIFQDESGAYFGGVMSRKRNELSHEEQVQISKDIGWTKK